MICVAERIQSEFRQVGAIFVASSICIVAGARMATYSLVVESPNPVSIHRVDTRQR